QPAIGKLRRQIVCRFVAGAEIDRDIVFHMQDRSQRLADAERTVAGVRETDLAPLMRHRRLAAEDLAHYRYVVLVAIVGSPPGFAVPALDDLRPRHAEAGDEAATA